MRVGVAFFLVALLLVSAVTVNANQFGTEAQCVTIGSDGREYPGHGPQRDPVGDDWIMYDNGEPSGLIVGRSYWSKVTFTPVSTFRLQAIHVLPLNQGPNNDESMQVRVYSEDQDNNGLVELLYETTIDEVNEFANDAEHVILLEEDEFVEFDANESFTIMYDAPGGPYNAGQNGAGWWNIYDGANNGRRSFYNVIDDFGDEPSDSHDDWIDLNGDLILRANGTYLDAFIDLELIALYNENDNWLVIPESEQIFTVDVMNNGDDVEFSVVTFQVMNLDGDVVWDNQVIVDAIGEGDEVSVSAEEAWTVPADLGNYQVWCIVEAEDDANDENNQAALDQVACNPYSEEDIDQWISFTDGTVETSTAWNEDSGWAVAFHHPGEGYDPIQLDAFRVQVWVEADAEIELDFNIHILDLEARLVTPIWVGTATTTGQGEDLLGGTVEWVEVSPEWEDEELNFCGVGKAFMVTYFYDNETRFPQDTDPPFAGTNSIMPSAHLNTQDDGQGYGFSNSGDYPIEAQISKFDGVIPGKHLEITPEAIDFGFNLELNTDYVIEAEFASVGSEDVNVSNIRISPTLNGIVTVEPSRDIDIPAGQSVVVTITFNASEDIMSDTQLLVSNDTEDAQIRWPFMASTGGAPGAHLETAEMDLDLGYNLAMNEDHVIVGTLTANGDEAVHVNTIMIPEEFANMITVDPAGDFDIESGASTEVTFTFNTAEEIEITTFIEVDNTSADSDVGWNFHAASIPMPPMMEVDPEELMFGVDLVENEDYVIDATISSTGDEALVIEGFTIPEGMGDFVTLTFEGDLPITLDPEATLAVTATFNGAEVGNIDDNIIIVNNSVNMADFEWHVRGSVFPDDVTEAPVVPAYYGLSQNYPNPFNPLTTIDFSLGQSGDVTLGVFDLSGRQVLEAVNAYMPAGSHSVEINMADLSAGTYLYRLHSGEFTSTMKMVLMK